MDSASRPDSSPPPLAFPLELSAVLGPDEDRYFASGYRSVRYEVDAIRASDDGESITADCTVKYPADWSRGADGAVRRPHLSTIDAMILPLLVAEQLAPGIQDPSSPTRIASFALRAGTEPWDRLDRVPVAYSAKPEGGSLRIVGEVGSIRSSVALADWPADAHARPTTPVTTRAWRRSASASRSVYGELALGTCTSTSLVDYDEGSRRLRSRHRATTTPENAAAEPRGLEAASWPGVTAIDHFTIMGQLTQAVIFLASGVDRARMGTLWMRTAKLEFHEAPSPLPAEWEATTTILRDRRVRGAEAVHDLLVQSRTTSGVTAEASLAYTETAVPA